MTTMENELTVECLELTYEPVPQPEDIRAWLKEAYDAGVDHGLETLLRELHS